VVESSRRRAPPGKDAADGHGPVKTEEEGESRTVLGAPGLCGPKREKGGGGLGP
jgi:hypothetical protein